MEEHLQFLVFYFTLMVLFLQLPKTGYHRKCLAILTFSMIISMGLYYVSTIAAGAYEYIEYNSGFVMLLTLYTVGTIVKNSAKDNLLMTL